MPLVLADRVKETTTTAGTGTVTLLGAAPGFQSFAVIGDANTTYYTIAGQTTSEWEVGIGTYTSSGTTLARTTVLSNSSGTQPSALSFSAGTKDVFVTYPSGKSVNLDASGNATALGTPVAFVGTNITGTASGLTAGNVTTNANLTGDVTSVGNATSIAAGVIVNADINASAGIVDTKLATISTASKVSNSATTATSANTANAIVARDASGNFSAGTITAALTGNASTVTTNANLTGDVTSSGNATTLATVNSNVGSFTFSSITVNAKGLITAASSGSAPAEFPSGTRLTFNQTAAPTGYTKSTSNDNKALRVVTGTVGTGGTTGFTTVFTNQTPTITTSGLSAGATTLTTAQIPSHSHSLPFTSVYTAIGAGVADSSTGWNGARGTGSAGGGGSHTHTVSGTATSTAITLDVAYVDVIIAQKN